MVFRGRSFRPPVLAAALLALAAWPPCWGDAALDALIAQLGSPSYPKREEAERLVEEAAAEHYVEIQEARVKVTDLEVQSRLDRVLASPRIRMTAAWSRALKDGATGLVLRETWMRSEHEDLVTGYQRLNLCREGEGLEATFEQINGDSEEEGSSVFRVSYLLDARFRLLSLKAEFSMSGEEATTYVGRMEPEGWTITVTPPGAQQDQEKGKKEPRLPTRLPWGSEDFPQEALLNLLPLWARAGAPGQEIAHNDIEYPTLVLKPMVVRDDGKSPRRLAFYLEGSDKPYMTLTLDKEGAVDSMLFSNNLKAVKVSAKEGLALKAKFGKSAKP